MKHRVFLAIDLPDKTRQKVLDLAGKLNPLHLPILWEKPEKLHLALNFLGKIADEQILQVNRQITAVSSVTVSFPLEIRFLNTLYQRHESSLVYLGLSGDLAPLLDLQKQLSGRFERISLPQPRRFFPHITIGRIKKSDPVTVKSQLGKIDDSNINFLAKFSVDHLTLYESLVSHSGSSYQTIRRFMLQS